MNDDAGSYARMFDIVNHARTLAASERAAYLDAECGADPALRSRVDALLAAGLEESDDDFAEGKLEDRRRELDGVYDASSANASTPWLPDRIGDYRIVRQLGQGGMGIVYEAEQESPRRRVAIKLLHPMHATVDRLRRFRQEAQVLGQLKHPGIAAIYEAGTYDLGRGPQPFFAMELVDGVDLRSHCDRNNLDRRARLELLAQVADAVQYAHDRGVIHRDLKPDNVLVDAHGHPRILDFGIARTSSQSATLSTVVTEEGQLVGTLAYMAPEQLEQAEDAITPQVDVYALGVLGFELLVGRLPREIENLSLTKAVHLLVSSDPPRASTFDPSLRGDIETILGKALESECTRRYPTASTVAADIRRFLANEPIVARAPTRLYLVRKFTRRHRALVGGATVAIVALTIGLILALIFGAQARDQRDLADRKANDAINGLLQSTQVLLAADRARDAAAQLQLVPSEARGVAWRFLHRAAPTIVEAPVGRVYFADDDHLVIHDRETQSLLLYSLVEHRIVKRLFEGSGLIDFWSCSTGGVVVARVDDDVLLLDLHEERVLSRAPLHHWSTEPEDEGGGVLREWQVSDDGRTVLSYRTANRAEVHVDGESVLEIPGLLNKERAALGPDGKHVVVNKKDSVTVLDVATGGVRLRHSIEAGQQATGSPVRGGVILHDGPLAGAETNALRTWRRVSLPDDGGEITVDQPFAEGFTHQVSSYYEFRYPRDGRYVAVGRNAHWWLGDTETGEPLRCEPLSTDLGGGHGYLFFEANVACTVNPSPSGRRLAIFSGYARTQIFEVDPEEAGTGEVDRDHRCVTFRGHGQPEGPPVPDSPVSYPGWIYHLAVSNDGSLVASSAPLDPWIRIWDTRTAAQVATLRRTVHDPGSWDALMAFSPNNDRLVVTTSYDGPYISLIDWNLLTGDIDVAARLPGHEKRHLELLDAFVEALQPEGRARLSQHAQMNGDRASVAFYPPKPQLATLPRSLPGERWQYLVDSGPSAEGMSLHPTKPQVAVVRGKHGVSRAGQLDVLELGTGTAVADRELEFLPYCCAYSPDGRVLAVGTREGRVLLYETKYYTQQLEWRAHDSFVYSIAWTPDGTRLVTGSGDATLKVWDTRTRMASRRDVDRWVALSREMRSQESLGGTLEGLTSEQRQAARTELIRRAHAR